MRYIKEANVNRINIQCYQDGDNFIVVFPNASAQMQDIIKNVLLTVTGCNDVKPVPHLDPPAPEPELTPNNFDSYEKVSITIDDSYNEFDIGTDLSLSDDIPFETPVETEAKAKPVKIATINNYAEMADIYTAIKTEEMSGNDKQRGQQFLKDFYERVVAKHKNPSIAVSRGEREQFIIACDRILKNSVSDYIKTKRHKTTESFLRFSNDQMKKELCAICAWALEKEI